MQNFTNSMSSCNIPQQAQTNYPFMTNNTRGGYDTLSGYSQHHAAAAALHHNQRTSCQVGYGSTQQQNSNASANGMYFIFFYFFLCLFIFFLFRII
jgi:hypothetical protein